MRTRRRRLQSPLSEVLLVIGHGLYDRTLYYHLLQSDEEEIDVVASDVELSGGPPASGENEIEYPQKYVQSHHGATGGATGANG